MAVGLLYMTHARTAEMLRATVIDALLCVASIAAGLPWGMVGVAASLQGCAELSSARVAMLPQESASAQRTLPTY